MEFTDDSGKFAGGENGLTTPSRRQSAQVRVHDTNQNEKKLHVLASDTSKRDGRSALSSAGLSGWTEEPSRNAADEGSKSMKLSRRQAVQVRTYGANLDAKKLYGTGSKAQKRSEGPAVTFERLSGWAEESAEIIAPEETSSEKSQSKQKLSRRQAAQVRSDSVNFNEKQSRVVDLDAAKGVGRSTISPARISGRVEEPTERIDSEETSSEKPQRKKKLSRRRAMEIRARNATLGNVESANESEINGDLIERKVGRAGSSLHLSSRADTPRLRLQPDRVSGNRTDIMEELSDQPIAEGRLSRRQAAQIQRAKPHGRLQQSGFKDTGQDSNPDKRQKRRLRADLKQTDVENVAFTDVDERERLDENITVKGENGGYSRLIQRPAGRMDAREESESEAGKKRRRNNRSSMLDKPSLEEPGVGRTSAESETGWLQAGTEILWSLTESDADDEGSLPGHPRRRLRETSLRSESADISENSENGVKVQDTADSGKRKKQNRLRHEPEPEQNLSEELSDTEITESEEISHRTGRRKTDPEVISASEASIFETVDAQDSHEGGDKGISMTSQISGDSSKSKKAYRRLYYESETSEARQMNGQNGSARAATGKKQKRQGLRFDDETSGMVIGAGMRPVKRAAAVAAGAASAAVHGKIAEAEDDSLSVEAAHQTEEAAEGMLHLVSRRNRQKGAGKSRTRRGRASGKHLNRSAENSMDESTSGRLHFSEEEVGTGTAGTSHRKREAEVEQEKKRQILKFWQKKRYKRAYAAAAIEKKQENQLIQTTQMVIVKARKAVKEAIVKRRVFLSVGGVFLVMFIMIAVSLSSCTALLEGGNNTFVSTTYPSDDADIYAVENAYAAMEAALQEQINSMESRNSGYDEYNYQIDEITHNPYHLISYFTAKYGQFTYEQVADELEAIFQAQYGISMVSSTETVTETKTVSVGESLGQVVTSGYCSCSICCGQWAGSPTSSGVYPTANHTIAVDASNPIVPVGTKIVMNGVEYTVEDTGNLSAYGVDFDVYYDSHSEALSHGHQTWEAYLADDNGSQSIEVTTTETVNQLYVTVTGTSLDAVLRSLMDSDEETRYDLYNYTYGNRSYLFDVDSLPMADGSSYSASAEALSDEKFAKMYAEAIKYLGVPYVWGGYSPSGFDCSGFVSYVINNCGNGWNYGRLTAEGLRSICTYVSPSEAQPGDLIFFQGTYNTSGASHVGIYIGDGKMIHCGSPVKISNINTEYYIAHFLSFGRLP
ncbi:MAG: NlpC/P60 family protein [Lachnospiraceae bacterium]|nr:NlpC/P60 family protein [Lachnospiraceae bacterium]